MNLHGLRKAALMTLVITGSLAAAGTVLAAEENFTLEELVVTASRVENKLVDTAANVNVITASDIEGRNYQTVSEALEDVPGLIVKRSGFNGGDQHIYLNGDDRVLILVDGRRLNQDKGTSGRSGFDITNLPSPDFIEKIEIVKGAGSSLYGSDAVGGVINIITKSAKKNYAKVNLNAGSWGTENYNAVVSMKEGKTGLFVTANKSRQDYVKFKQADNSRTTRWPNSANEQTGVTIKVDQEIGEDQLATLYFDHSFKEGGRPNYAPNLGGYDESDLNGRATDLNNNVSGRYEWNRNGANKGFVQVYRNHYVGHFNGMYSNGYYYETKDGFEVQQNIKLAEDNNLVVGAEWRQSDVENPGTYGGKLAKINNKALYVQDTWSFADTWSLNAGLRYDKHNYFGNETTLSLSLNKKFDDNSHAYLSWGQVFNAPQANDLFWYEDTGYGYFMLGNPNLKPETGDVFTIGYDAKINDKLQIGASAFYSELKDAIKWAAVDPTSWTSDWTVYNVAEQKKRGFELNGKYAFNDSLSLNASYAHVKVEEASSAGAAFTRDYNVLPNQYKLGLAYKDGKWNADLYGRGGSGGAKDKYVDSKYLTLDMSLQYRPTADWKVYLKGYNLTNAAYAEQGGIKDGKYKYPASGRAFIIGTEYTF